MSLLASLGYKNALTKGTSLTFGKLQVLTESMLKHANISQSPQEAQTANFVPCRADCRPTDCTLCNKCL